MREGGWSERLEGGGWRCFLLLLFASWKSRSAVKLSCACGAYEMRVGGQARQQRVQAGSRDAARGCERDGKRVHVCR